MSATGVPSSFSEPSIAPTASSYHSPSRITVRLMIPDGLIRYSICSLISLIFSGSSTLFTWKYLRTSPMAFSACTLSSVRARVILFPMTREDIEANAEEKLSSSLCILSLICSSNQPIFFSFTHLTRGMHRRLPSCRALHVYRVPQLYLCQGR